MSEPAATAVQSAPPDCRIVNVGPDTFFVNFKCADEHGNLTGAALPESIMDQLDEWQKEAKRQHEPVPTSLTFAYMVGSHVYEQTLFIRSHGAPQWSWLLYCDDLKLEFAPGTLNAGLFCRARFSSHLLHTISASAAMIAVEALLESFLGGWFHEQSSEIHLCADLQGFDFSRLSLLGEQLPFVSRVTAIRDRPTTPTEEEQEGGLSAGAITALEKQIEQEKHDLEAQDRIPLMSVLTAHRRIATIDFGSHASELSAQIYNKSLEIKKHKKEWIEPIWLSNGWDGSSTVWRVEFRFRRPFLRRFELDEAFSVVDLFPVLWRYATQQWLRLVDLDAPRGQNVSRIPTHPVWEVIQHAYDALDREQSAPADPVGERMIRVEAMLYDKPLQVLKQAASYRLLSLAQEELSLPDEVLAFLWDGVTVPCSLLAAWLSVGFLARLLWAGVSEYLATEDVGLQETMQDEPVPVVRELARETFLALPLPEQDSLLAHLMPLFEVARCVLVKRDRQMARLKGCIAGALGNLRSAVALMPQEELPGFLGPGSSASRTQPDLWSSLIWFADKARAYDAERDRVFVEEVHKKRLRYNLITALQFEEERKQYGVELPATDWAVLDQVHAELRAGAKKQQPATGAESDIA